MDKAKTYDAVLSLGCGAGVQMVADLLEPETVLPGVNTRFIGITLEEGSWAERCRACGICVLGDTGGICPIALCSKSLLNGPCGGAQNGKCETSKDRDCAWILIVNRLAKQGKLDKLTEITPPKDYRPKGVPEKVVNEAYKKAEKTEAHAK